MNTYKLFLKDGSIIDSTVKDDWKSISEEARVSYFNGFKTVYLCTLPVVKIKIQRGELETEIDVPEDCRVYRAIRAGTTFSNGARKEEIYGQCAGLVKDGEVVEERLINAYEGIIQGWRK